MSATRNELPEPLRRLAHDDPVLMDQHGRPIRFIADLVGKRRMLVNATYSGCSENCPVAIHNLLQARPLLGPQGRNLGFASITLTPLEDTPAQLRRMAARYELPSDWTVLTGTPRAVEQTLSLLGLAPWSEGSEESLRHLSVARLCDAQRIRWAHINLLLKPRSIARMIRYELA